MSYIIEDLIQRGYWSQAYKAWKGILFATRFKTLETAKLMVKNIIDNGESKTVTIIEIIE